MLDKKSSFFLYINSNGEKKFNLCDVGTMCAVKKKESIKWMKRRRMMVRQFGAVDLVR